MMRDATKEDCEDNRLEVIERVKTDLIEKTNIMDSPEEMSQLDNILFRLWQINEIK